jgi:hypothetical protein
LCEVGPSPPSSAEVKNEWIYTSTPTDFTMWTGVTEMVTTSTVLLLLTSNDGRWRGPLLLSVTPSAQKGQDKHHTVRAHEGISHPTYV